MNFDEDTFITDMPKTETYEYEDSTEDNEQDTKTEIVREGDLAGNQTESENEMLIEAENSTSVMATASNSKVFVQFTVLFSTILWYFVFMV